jgi:hypothetical protein
MKRYLKVLIGFSVMGLAACSTTDVQTEKAAEADLSHYRTFSWEAPNQLEQPHEFSAKNDEILDAQIKSEVGKDLSIKGLTESSQNPDLRLSYAVRTRENVQVEPAFLPYPYFGAGPTEPIERVVENREGSLALDLIDAKTGRLVWRGVAVSDVNKAGPDQDQIRSSVDEIIKKLPKQTRNS